MVDHELIFHFRHEPFGNQNFGVRPSVAKTRRKIGHGSHCRIVEPLLKANHSDGRVSAGNPPAATQFVAAVIPHLSKFFKSIAHRNRHF